jgi:predicted deacylase
VRLWAQSFDDTHLPLLDQPPGGLAEPTNADLDAEVTAFLAENPSALARGIALGARMLRNPFAAELFVPRLLDRLGDGAFDVALETMNFLVNHQIGLLASLGPGAGFLWRLRTILSLPSAGLSADRERLRLRALRMIPTEYVLGTSAGGRPIEAFFFEGRSSERALVIGGVHGTEGPGVDVARRLVRDLQNASSRPRFTTIVVPVLFPDNLDAARGGGGGRSGRRSTRGHVDPNRQLPRLGESLAAARARGGGTAVDAEGRRIEAENVMLLNLIDRFRPSRIASVHAITNPRSAGIFSDPHTRAPGASAAEQEAARAATQADEALATAMGATARQEGARVRSSSEITPGPHDPGVSFGGWAPRPIAEGGPHDRPSMTVITMELPRTRATEADVAGHTRALREDFLDLEP